jgi:hypothetical protein
MLHGKGLLSSTKINAFIVIQLFIHVLYLSTIRPMISSVYFVATQTCDERFIVRLSDPLELEGRI